MRIIHHRALAIVLAGSSACAPVGPDVTLATVGSSGLAVLGCGDPSDAADTIESAHGYLLPTAEDTPEDRAEIEELRTERFPGLRPPEDWRTVTNPAECASVLAALLRDVPWLSAADLRTAGDSRADGEGFSIVRLEPYYIVSTYRSPKGGWFDGGCLYQARVRDRQFQPICYQGW